MNIWWIARDTFRQGGVLVDQETVYAARDKMQHLVGAAGLAAMLGRRPAPHGLVLLLVLLVGLGVEVLELVRWLQWTAAIAAAHGVAPGLIRHLGDDEIAQFALEHHVPRPRWCDRASWRDMVANAVGAALGIWIL